MSRRPEGTFSVDAGFTLGLGTVIILVLSFVLKCSFMHHEVMYTLLKKVHWLMVSLIGHIRNGYQLTLPGYDITSSPSCLQHRKSDKLSEFMADNVAATESVNKGWSIFYNIVFFVVYMYVIHYAKSAHWFTLIKAHCTTCTQFVTKLHICKSTCTCGTQFWDAFYTTYYRCAILYLLFSFWEYLPITAIITALPMAGIFVEPWLLST